MIITAILEKSFLNIFGKENINFAYISERGCVEGGMKKDPWKYLVLCNRSAHERNASREFLVACKCFIDVQPMFHEIRFFAVHRPILLQLDFFFKGNNETNVLEIMKIFIKLMKWKAVSLLRSDLICKLMYLY